MMSDQKKRKKKSAKQAPSSAPPDWTATWGTELEAAICEHCDWSYLLPPGETQPLCLHCFQGELERIGDAAAGLPYNHPPELILPFSLPQGLLEQSLQKFARAIPFAPRDLNPQSLATRLHKVFLPMWLVDADVRGSWQSEVGFDYNVVSFQDRFSDRQGGWSSQRVTETRVRWEPRMGKLDRTYENIPAPAMEEHAKVTAQLGEHQLTEAEGYLAASIEGASVRLPTRAPEDAWPDAVPALRTRAAEEVQRASGAAHQRDFRWSPEYSKKNWTQVLLPAYTTHYLDDEQAPQPLMIHGQTGKISGARRSSMKRARRASLVILAVAAMLGFPSLLGALFPFLPVEIRSVAGCSVALAFLLGITAIIPVSIASLFNRRNRGTL